MKGLKEDNILRMLKRLNLSIAVSIDRMFEDNDLTAAQCDILSYLMDHENREVCSTDIHVGLGTSRASVSMILKRLRQKGYVTFRQSRQDDRQKWIFLTERACRLKQKMDEKAAEIDGCLYRGFTLEERETMDQMTRRMLGNLTILGSNGEKESQCASSAEMEILDTRRAEIEPQCTGGRNRKEIFYDKDIAETSKTI